MTPPLPWLALLIFHFLLVVLTLLGVQSMADRLEARQPQLMLSKRWQREYFACLVGAVVLPELLLLIFGLAVLFEVWRARR